MGKYEQIGKLTIWPEGPQSQCIPCQYKGGATFHVKHWIKSYKRTGVQGQCRYLGPDSKVGELKCSAANTFAPPPYVRIRLVFTLRGALLFCVFSATTLVCMCFVFCVPRERPTANSTQKLE